MFKNIINNIQQVQNKIKNRLKALHLNELFFFKPSFYYIMLDLIKTDIANLKNIIMSFDYNSIFLHLNVYFKLFFNWVKISAWEHLHSPGCIGRIKVSLHPANTIAETPI